MHVSGFTQFQQIRAETIRLAKELTQAESSAAPAPGEWSPSQILDHLILSEKLHRKTFAELIGLEREGKRPVILRTLTELDTSVFGIPKAVIPLFTLPLVALNTFVPSQVREFFVKNRILPANNPKASEPAPDRPIGDLIRDLEQSIRETETLFASNPKADYERMRICHPMLGNNNVPGLLRILYLHEQRHQDQLRQAVATIRKRAPRAAFAN